MSDFANDVLNAIRANASMDDVSALLCGHRDRGLRQEEATAQLEALRPDLRDEEEDRLLDVLDLVVGWCAAERRIWL